MSEPLHARQALDFVREQGVVFASAKGAVRRRVHGKITLVHKRLWPALVRVADRFTPEQLAQIREEHMPTARHVTTEIAFPQWVPSDVQLQASLLSEVEAVTALGPGVFAKRAVSRAALGSGGRK